ncbi:hypothetical protein [Xaviernesmea rhizosphaerae]|uniref:hypothetical protein n=1 Tax=Xaviernesmea rhizosphaerae TaxID=1672749 RepID=UPI003CCA2A5D
MVPAIRAALTALILAGSLTSTSAFTPAMAAEEDFLPALGGRWTGGGTVITRIGSAPIRVTCDFDSKASARALAMSGRCRGLLVVRRAVSADITRAGARYAGSYTGPSGRPAALSGRRSGDSLDFSVRWSREINGDREARMTIRRIGQNGLQLRTLDRDPKTGKTVVTSDLTLRR